MPSGQSAPCNPLLIVPRARKIQKRKYQRPPFSGAESRASTRHQRARERKQARNGSGCTRWGEDPDPKHRGEDQRRGDSPPLAAQPPGEEIGGGDPSGGGERVRQPQGEFALPENGAGNEHHPVDQRRLLHARKAVAHRDKPVVALRHLADGGGVEALVVVEDDRGEAGAEIEERDEPQDQPRPARGEIGLSGGTGLRRKREGGLFQEGGGRGGSTFLRETAETSPVSSNFRRGACQRRSQPHDGPPPGGRRLPLREC